MASFTCHVVGVAKRVRLERIVRPAKLPNEIGSLLDTDELVPRPATGTSSKVEVAVVSDLRNSEDLPRLYPKTLNILVMTGRALRWSEPDQVTDRKRALDVCACHRASSRPNA